MPTPGSIDLAAIQTAFDDLAPFVFSTITKYQEIIALGSRPVFGNITEADADYNDILTAQNLWDAEHIQLIVQFNDRVRVQKEREDILLALLRPNQWFYLSRLRQWLWIDEAWVGIRNNIGVIYPEGRNISLMYSITALDFDPVAKFPYFSGTHIPGPQITSDPIATVDDASIKLTYIDNPDWRANVTQVFSNGTLLDNSAWSLSAGRLSLIPANDTALQVSGLHYITVKSTGFLNCYTVQFIANGVAVGIEIFRQPTAPATNPGVLTIQPIVNVVDQYGNICLQDVSTILAVVGGVPVIAWVLGGTTSENAVAGVATFADLDATCASSLVVALIEFQSDYGNVTSASFSIPAP